MLESVAKPSARVVMATAGSLRSTAGSAGPTVPSSVIALAWFDHFLRLSFASAGRSAAVWRVELQQQPVEALKQGVWSSGRRVRSPTALRHFELMLHTGPDW
jgi:hypothetical protein